jgi:hypothetical protein
MIAAIYARRSTEMVSLHVPQQRQEEESGGRSHDRNDRREGEGGRAMADSDPMDDFARRLLEQFVKAANLSVGVGSLHVLDWNHFYDFIIHTHRRQLRISDQDVATALFGYGVSIETAGALGAHYSRGLDLLQRYDKGASMIAAIYARKSTEA